jgi:hypothetical protein
MSAALPSQCAGLPILPIGDGSLWQALVLGGLGIPFLALPQRGTVSASALDLGFALSRGEVYLTGVDLSHRDIRTHARPYAFDRLWDEEADRLRPRYGRYFTRSREMNAGGSQGIYAAWFRGQLPLWPRRPRPLGGNSPVFGEGGGLLPPGEGEERPRPRAAPLPLAGDAASRGLELLLRALGDETLGARLGAELGPLLLPGEENPSLEDIREAALRRGALY